MIQCKAVSLFCTDLQGFKLVLPKINTEKQNFHLWSINYYVFLRIEIL